MTTDERTSSDNAPSNLEEIERELDRVNDELLYYTKRRRHLRVERARRYMEMHDLPQYDVLVRTQEVVEVLQDDYSEGVPVDVVVREACRLTNLDESGIRQELERLKRCGEVYEPYADQLRVI